MIHIDVHGNETRVFRKVQESVSIWQQAEVFFEYLKGIGYSVETIEKFGKAIDELL